MEEIKKNESYKNGVVGVLVGSLILFAMYYFGMFEEKYKVKPCEVGKLAISFNEYPELTASFGFKFSGKLYNIEKISGDNVLDSPDKVKVASEFERQFKRGEKFNCYMNTDDPILSKIMPDKRRVYYKYTFLFIATFFILGGIGEIGVAVAGKKSLVDAVVCVICPLITGIFIGHFAFPGALMALQSPGWVEKKAEVVHMRINEDKENDSLSADIVYTYTHKGEKYTSMRYGFNDMGRSGETEEHKVKYYKTGAAIRCFMNPEDPGETVLNKNKTKALIFACIPLFFYFSAILGIIHLRKKARLI